MIMPVQWYHVALLGCVIALAGCDGTKAPEGKPARPVAVSEAEAATALPPLRLPGIVMPREGVRLSFKTGGVLRSLVVREGDRVVAGQVLAQLESVEFDSALRQAREGLDKAERDLERAQRLQAEDVVPRQMVDDLRSQRDVAKAQWDAVRFNHERATLRAPRDGRVLRRLAEPAELLAPGQPVLLLESDDAGQVLRVGISDRDIVSLAKGQAARLEFDAFPGQSFGGRILELPGGAAERGGLFEVSLSVQQPPAGLRSGMVGRALIERPAAGATLVRVPVGAIVEADGERAHVFVPVDGKARRRAVQVAWIDGDQVALREGIVAGEKVITAGALFLADGDSVILP